MNGENGRDEVVDFGDVMDEKAEQILFGKNPNRCDVLRDMWFQNIQEVAEGTDAPEEKKMEIVFMAAANSVLDMVMDIIPPKLSLTLVRNLDGYLKITMVNDEYDTDLMKEFQEEFVEAKGAEFESQEDLDNAVEVFEENWWNTKRDELDGKSPNRAMREMGQKYDI